MLRKLSIPALALAVAGCLALAGCGAGPSSLTASGGSTSAGSTSGGSTSGGSHSSDPFSPAGASAGSNSSACTAFAAAYKRFLAGYVPPESQTGTNETPLQALSDAVANITASGQTETDLADLGIDAGLIATGSTEGGQTTPPSAFYSDLQAVGKSCGTTFSQPPASLVKEG